MNRFIGAGNQATGDSVVTALLVCDQVIAHTSGQRTIIGIFDTILSRVIPFSMPRFCVYLEILIGANEPGPFFLGIFDPNGRPFVPSELNIQNWTPGSVAQIEMPMPGILFSLDGVYSLQVFRPGRILLERKFVVRKPPESLEAQADSPTP